MQADEFISLYKDGRRDFRGVDLQKVELDYLTLNYNLDLSEANLSEIVIYKCDLTGVRLHKAILKNADLKEVNMSELCLQEADLSKAFLFDVGLSYSNLRGANLSKLGGFEVCFLHLI